MNAKKAIIGVLFSKQQKKGRHTTHCLNQTAVVHSVN
jgi:hypothetical protein